ncbi:hypothetical protein [Marinobacter sp. SS13-12]|uniref:hypothetical protein n=1 Tax=Marinobacter sp. SS13-12 TaxID=3050451 RepID=UPI00255313FD|nr:hypothetical protein [Marinobacter sp. SS13-12]MDK8462569.1 hypothetical protein [Marinobacter sp. SS13-12]
MNIAIINNLKGNQEVIEKVRAGSGAAYWYQHFMQTPGLPEAMIPGAEETWLGHFLQEEQPAAVAGYLNDFLDND